MAVRYPRGGQEECGSVSEYRDYSLVGDGARILIVTYGRLYVEALRARKTLIGEGYPVDILKLTRLAPFPEEILGICKQYQKILFYEEGIRGGGIGEQLFARLAQAGFVGTMQLYAIDNFVPQAKVSEALERLELDAKAMARAIKALNIEENGGKVICLKR